MSKALQKLFIRCGSSLETTEINNRRQKEIFFNLTLKLRHLKSVCARIYLVKNLIGIIKDLSLQLKQ